MSCEASSVRASSTVPDRGDLHVLGASEELRDRLPGHLVVLEHQHLALGPQPQGHDPLDGLAQAGVVDVRWEGERRARVERVAFLGRLGDHGHRHVPGLAAALEVPQGGEGLGHRPAVQQDAGGPEPGRQREAGGAVQRGDHVVAARAAEADDPLGLVLVGHQRDQAGLTGPDALAVVVDGRQLGRLGHAASGGFDRSWRAAHRDRRELVDGAGDVGTDGVVLQRDVGDREVEAERRALARGAVEGELAAEQDGQLAADGQPEAGAAVATAAGPVALLEGLEHDGPQLVADADAGVVDVEGHDLGLAQPVGERVPVHVGGDPQADLALVGELDRVGEEVLEDLLQPSGVGVELVVAGVELDVQRQALVRRHLLEPLDDRGDRVLDADRGGGDVHPAGLDLGQVEDVVDQVEQVVARPVDRLGELALLVVEHLGVVGEHAGEDQHAVERRPQLVGHVGEELGLVARRPGELLGPFLDLGAGPLDLGVGELDRALLGLEQLGLLLELLVGLLELLGLGLQLLGLRLQLLGEALGLLEQLLGPHRGLDRVQHDAEGLDELVEQLAGDRGEGPQRGELEHPHQLVLEQDGITSTLTGAASPSPDWTT
jgi:hypothetical protein